MPRGKTNAELSNLSVLIPRTIHRAAKARGKQIHAPSFAAYVAFVLNHGPEIPIDSVGVEFTALEKQLKVKRPE